MSIVIIHAIIKGIVQGVGYRNWAATTAKHLGLNGWVKNNKDGSVEAVFAGEQSVVNQMIDACYKGPSLAQVTSIEQHIITTPIEAGFRIIYN